jgi:hypothetical protein
LIFSFEWCFTTTSIVRFPGHRFIWPEWYLRLTVPKFHTLLVCCHFDISRGNFTIAAGDNNIALSQFHKKAWIISSHYYASPPATCNITYDHKANQLISHARHYLFSLSASRSYGITSYNTIFKFFITTPSRQFRFS